MAPILTIFGPNESQRCQLNFEKNLGRRKYFRAGEKFEKLSRKVRKILARTRFLGRNKIETFIYLDTPDFSWICKHCFGMHVPRNAWTSRKEHLLGVQQAVCISAEYSIFGIEQVYWRAITMFLTSTHFFECPENASRTFKKGEALGRASGRTSGWTSGWTFGRAFGRTSARRTCRQRRRNKNHLIEAAPFVRLDQM